MSMWSTGQHTARALMRDGRTIGFIDDIETCSEVVRMLNELEKRRAADGVEHPKEAALRTLMKRWSEGGDWRSYEAQELAQEVEEILNGNAR